MIIFECLPEGAQWKILRDEKLVCYYASFDNARRAVEGFAGDVRAYGGQAEVRFGGNAQPADAADDALSEKLRG